LAGSNKESGTEKEEQKGGMHPGIVVLIVVLLLGVVAVGLLVGYKYWRKKNRNETRLFFFSYISKIKSNFCHE
jgi:predicted negative regulator of RcsB-dependent stress response